MKNETKSKFKKWHNKPENKKWMKSYMKDYYKKNKTILRLTSNKKYNSSSKNKVRNKIINYIKNYNINKILTLESKDFLFANLLPKNKLIVFEKDKKEFDSMKRLKPKNVSLFYGDISDFENLDSKTDFVYLDFCGCFETEQQTIYNLKNTIAGCKLLGLTFCLRKGSEIINEGYVQHGDYQFDLIRKIQELLEINFKVIYGEAYRDTTGMVTILLENTQ